MTDLDILDRVLAEDARLRADDADEGRCLFQNEREVFAGWLERERPLSDAQLAWLNKAAVRLGVIAVAPAANTFSGWTPEKQARERALVKTKLPFEGQPRALKPPGR